MRESKKNAGERRNMSDERIPFFYYSLPFDSRRKREREGAEWKTNRYVMTDIEYDYEASRLIDTIGIIYTITESETVLSLPIAELSPVSATSRWIIIMTRHRFTVRASQSGFRRERRVTINENSLIRYPSDIEAAAEFARVGTLCASSCNHMAFFL